MWRKSSAFYNLRCCIPFINSWPTVYEIINRIIAHNWMQGEAEDINATPASSFWIGLEWKGKLAKQETLKTVWIK